MGTVTFHFGTIPVARAFDFAPSASGVDWFRIRYAHEPDEPPDGPPFLDYSAPLDAILICRIPDICGTSPPYLASAHVYHTACVLFLNENATTVAEAPETILVDVINLDASGVEIDRAGDVPLSLDPDDGDPTRLTYHSDLATPIVFVDRPIDEEMYPDLIILVSEAGGSTIAVASQP